MCMHCECKIHFRYYKQTWYFQYCCVEGDGFQDLDRALFCLTIKLGDILENYTHAFMTKMGNNRCVIICTDIAFGRCDEWLRHILFMPSDVKCFKS